jgi:hypothetical protein
MSEISLEALAKRVEALEQALARHLAEPPKKDWRGVVGTFADSEIMRQVDAEGQAIRAAEREEARRQAEAQK